MKFTDAIEEYFTDMRSAGRINSARTEVSYRGRLMALSGDVGNRDPRTIGREDIKRTLRRWPHPNTQRNARAIYVSFFDWSMEEGIRKDNPARQTRRPRKRATTVYRLTREESVTLMDVAAPGRERWTIVLGPPEAEGVLVETVEGDVRLTLDDGELLILDRDELLSALGVSPAVVGLREAA